MDLRSRRRPQLICHEDRNLQHQQYQSPPAQSVGWLERAKPDIVALQELKSTDGDFPQGAIEKAGYGAVWRGQKTWNGVAILARNADPVLIRNALPGDSNDDQARYIEAAVKGIL